MDKVLITHVDLDGVFCRVLGRLAFGDELRVVHVRNPKEATEKLLGLEVANDHMVFVTDVSFSVAEVANRGLNIKIFDHHATAVNEVSPFLWADVRVNKGGRPTCGTELFHNYLVAEGLIVPCPWIIEQVRAYDTWAWANSESRIPAELSQLCFTLGFDKFVDAFVWRLRYSDVDETTVFSTEERVLLDFVREQEEKEIKRYLAVAQSIPTPYGAMGFVFIGEGVNQSLLGNAILNEMSVEFAIMANPNTGKISARSREGGVHVGKLMRRLFGDSAGGHACAAGAMLPSEDVNAMAWGVQKKFMGVM